MKPYWSIKGRILQPVRDWWQRQCFAFACYSALRKLPATVVFTCLENYSTGPEWVATGIDLTTGDRYNGRHLSPYVAIRRMQRSCLASAEKAEMRQKARGVPER